MAQVGIRTMVRIFRAGLGDSTHLTRSTMSTSAFGEGSPKA